MKQTDPDHAALQEATAKWQEVLASHGVSEDEVLADFKRWRRRGRK